MSLCRSVSALSVVLCINFSCEDLHHVQQLCSLLPRRKCGGRYIGRCDARILMKMRLKAAEAGGRALACPPQCGWGVARWGPAGSRPVPVPVPGTGDR